MEKVLGAVIPTGWPSTTGRDRVNQVDGDISVADVDDGSLSISDVEETRLVANVACDDDDDDGGGGHVECG